MMPPFAFAAPDSQISPAYAGGANCQSFIARTIPCSVKSNVPGWLIGWLVLLVALVGNPSATHGQTIYEAENAVLSGFVFDTQYAGYSGTGYAKDNNATGDYIQFALTATAAGNYPIAFRYANGGTANRPLSLTVNGVVVNSSLSFPVTGSWSTWAFTTTNAVPLNPGRNTVQVTDTTGSGPHVDYLLVATNGTSGPPPAATNAPLRRPISPNQPMWLIHIDSWNYPDPQKIINLIPADIRPYVVMNISLSIDESTNGWLQCAYGYQTAESWLRVCAENGMWAMIQPASGGQSHFSDFDLTVYENFYRNYPNFIGFNYAEQFWGFGPPLAVTWTQRVAHWVDLMKLNQKYGGYLDVSWCGEYYGASINPIAMMKQNPAFAAICQQSPKNFILEEKYTSNYGFYDIESTCLGTYLAGFCGQYGIRYDNTGWVGYNASDAFHVGAASAPIIEHGMLTGETVMDGPEIIWEQCIQGLNNGTTSDGYTTRQWGLFAQFPNVSLDIFRKILDGTIRIPARREVIDRTKVVIVNDVNSGSAQAINSSPQTLFDGLYLMTGDGTNGPDGDWLSQTDYFKKTGRYPSIPTVYQLADTNAQSFQVPVSNSLYATRWPTITAKTNELNGLFPQEYTGDIYAGRYQNGWVIYNPYKSGQTATGSIAFKYNTCDHLALTLAQYTAGVMKEYPNSMSLYLNNYDGPSAAMRTDVLSVYGSSAQPTYSYVDRASHAASTVTTSWSGGVFTLNVTHNGALDLTVNCAGTGIGRLTAYTNAAITAPAKPLVYAGPHQYEAENFDYKSIGGDTTEGIGTSISNYNAMGYLNFGTSSSARARYTNVIALTTGAYRLETRYAVTGSTIGTIDLYVNGTKVATPSFTPIAALSNWATNKQTITLNAGTNTIEFRANATAAGSLYFDDIVVVPTVYNTGVILQEYGAGFTSVNGTVDTNYSGYTGNGYAHPAAAYGAGIDWQVNADSSVTKALTFRYAGTNDSTADLLVNGTNVAAGIVFPATGAGTNWDYITVYSYLAPGASDVRLQAATNTGLPNIDYLEITGIQPFPAAPARLGATGGNGVVNLGWTQSTNSNVTTNRVYRSATGAPGSFSLLTSMAATTTYADTAIVAGTPYYYSVTAINTNGESALSASAMAVPFTNTPPLLAPIANRTTGAGVTLTITNTATDTNVPAPTLAYSLLQAPTNALLNPGSGVLVWRPLVTQANTTNPFVVQVADNGVPSLTATQSFLVTVTNLSSPVLSIPLFTPGQVVLQVGGDYGPDYQIQASSNLVNWSVLFTTNAPAMPFTWTNLNSGSPLDFFRILAGPPF